jgi:4-hydroxybenzoate polyprenyltransferase
MSHPVKSKANAWLQLIRLPNLFTVPGDPLAGYLLALPAMTPVNLRTTVLLCITALSFYTCGLITNDIADIKEDRRERPHRPLPSNRIALPAAWTGALLLTVFGLLTACLVSTSTLIVSFILLALILSYNFYAKQHRIIGPVCMGLCRGCSLLLGAAALNLTPTAAIAALSVTAYITAVTVIARQETQQAIRPSSHKWHIPLILTAGLSLVLCMQQHVNVLPLLPALLMLAAVANALLISLRLGNQLSPQRTPAFIGKYIRNLLIIQATLCAIHPSAGMCFAIPLLLLYPLSATCSKRFYAS